MMLGTAQGSRTPSGMKVAPMSYKKLETVAEGVRRYLPTAVSFGSATAWRVDAVRVLEQVLPKAQFHFHVVPVDELRECAAFTIPEHRLVVIRQDVYEGLFNDEVFSRSTVIHELSHIVLNHAVTLHRGATLGQHEFYEDSEWQANSLTAAILMPIAACRVACSASELARTCGTSVQAATYRIENLGKRKVLDMQQYQGQLFG
jgi:IrrE N-terminal-like domain